MGEDMTEQFIITQKEAKKLWDKLFGVEYTVESMDHWRKKQGVKYKTHHKGDDTWECNCESFKYDSGTIQVTMLDTGRVHPKTCKHIRYVMEKEKMPFKESYGY